MSYDVFLRGAEGIGYTASDLYTFFQGRALRNGSYRVMPLGVSYESRDTQVYFAIDLAAHGGQNVATLRVNVPRPHVFALEVAAEMETICKVLRLRVEDPQPGGISGRSWSSREFLRGYERANRRACGETSWPIAAAVMERTWQWNRTAPEMQRATRCFVPNVLYGTERDRAVTYCVWGDAMPIHLPEVDWVVIARRALARGPNGAMESAAVAYGAARELLSRFEARDAPHRHHVLDYDETPREIDAFVRSLEPSRLPFSKIAFDRLRAA
jgi:hypothetical protein